MRLGGDSRYEGAARAAVVPEVPIQWKAAYETFCFDMGRNQAITIEPHSPKGLIRQNRAGYRIFGFYNFIWRSPWREGLMVRLHSGVVSALGADPCPDISPSRSRLAIRSPILLLLPPRGSFCVFPLLCLRCGCSRVCSP